MKTSQITLKLFVALFLISLLPACSGEDGKVGPEGAQGLQGLVGPAGDDGSVIYSNEGMPNDNTGKTGDYCLDTSSGIIYGPKKSDTSWTNADSFSVKGADGANGVDGADGTDGTDGADGTTIHAGEGKPATTIGNLGDYYLDISSYTLYGPKAKSIMSKTSTWGMGLVLKGAEGNANVKTFKYSVNADDWSIGQNTAAYEYKWMQYQLEFPALTKDIYDNGFVLVYWINGPSQYQLPFVSYSTQQNLLSRNYVIRYTGGKYSLELRNQLEARNDKTQLLIANTLSYKIIVVSGQSAVQLKNIDTKGITLEELEAFGIH